MHRTTREGAVLARSFGLQLVGVSVLLSRKKLQLWSMCPRVLCHNPPRAHKRMGPSLSLFLAAAILINQVCVNMDTCAVAAGAGGTVGDVLGDAFAIDATSGWRLQPKHPSEGERPDYVGNIAAKRGDRRADFVKMTLWSPQSRSLNANLASVFGKEGIDEARRDSAALSAGRTELMARCYATLRVALQDLIEWKVGGVGM